MKTKVLTLICILAIGVCSVPSTVASEVDSVSTVADVLVARPVCFAATVIGSAFFVLSLPVALPSKSVKKTARTLVVKPAKATFTRPVGDFSDLDD